MSDVNKSLSLGQYRTYAGMLDDVMIRYSNRYAGPEFFNKMILKSVFFGGGLYINDGYLVNHPEARNQIMRSGSLLDVMLSTGFVNIYTRTTNAEELAQLPEIMAKGEQKNASFAALVKSDIWPSFKKRWSRVAQAAYTNRHITRWPDRDLAFGYTHVMESNVFARKLEVADIGLVHVSDDDFKRIRDGFLELDPARAGPRDRFERSAIEVLYGRKDYRQAMHELMRLASEAYHYNHGLALHVSGMPTSVETTPGRAFAPLQEMNVVCREQLEDLPLFAIATDFPFDDGRPFYDFCVPTSEIYESKEVFLEQLEASIQGVGTRENRAQALEEASDQYKRHVGEHFAKHYPKTAVANAVGNSFAVRLANSGLKSSVGAVSETLPNLVAHVDATNPNKPDYGFVIERFRLAETEEEDDTVITASDITGSQFISLAFHPEALKDYASSVPQAPVFK